MQEFFFLLLRAHLHTAQIFNKRITSGIMHHRAYVVYVTSISFSKQPNGQWPPCDVTVTQGLQTLTHLRSETRHLFPEIRVFSSFHD